MLPEELRGLLTSMHVAADVVEAIDTPALQAKRGWDLARWSYDCIPWGVRFLRRDDRQRITAAAKFAQEIQAAPIGQVQIKQQRVIRYGAHCVLRRLQPFEPVDRVPRRANMLLHSRSEMRLIFN